MGLEVFLTEKASKELIEAIPKHSGHRRVGERAMLIGNARQRQVGEGGIKKGQANCWGVLMLYSQPIGGCRLLPFRALLLPGRLRTCLN